MIVKRFGNYSFMYVGPIQPVCDKEGNVKTFMPQVRYANSAPIPLNAYGLGPFCRFRVSSNLPLEGVYILTLDGKPHYVGECVNLSKRYNNGYGNISPRNCYIGGQLTNCRINNLIYVAAKSKQRIELWFFETPNRKAVETELIRILGTRQHWNRRD